MGPSRPADPPLPIHRAEAITFAMTTRGRIRPPRNAIACMTSGTPCPFASFAKYAIIGPANSPPIAGASAKIQILDKPKAATLVTKNAFWIKAISRIKRTAPSPVPAPTTIAVVSKMTVSEGCKRSSSVENSIFLMFILLSFVIRFSVHRYLS